MGAGVRDGSCAGGAALLGVWVVGPAMTSKRLTTILLGAAAVVTAVGSPAAALPSVPVPGPLKNAVPDTDNFASTLNSGNLMGKNDSQTAQHNSTITNNNESIVSLFN